MYIQIGKINLRITKNDKVYRTPTPNLLSRLGSDTSTPQPNINSDLRPVEIPRSNPVFRGREVLRGSPVTLNINIAFNKATDVISNYTIAREKLNDIAEALIKDPRLSGFIVGNIEMEKEKMDELG